MTQKYPPSHPLIASFIPPCPCAAVVTADGVDILTAR